MMVESHSRLTSLYLAPSIANDTAITTLVTRAIRTSPGRVWWGTLLLSILGTAWFIWTIGYILYEGIGAWGINTTVVWGSAIAAYVWWIGVGNAGTLISSMLLLTRQPWRASINRFAETMTLLAISIAGLMPIIHLGRPLYFYWLAPLPNTMGLWPQWRSALVWDFWAILSYLIFSILFWYHGLIPDLATMRDRASGNAGRRLYGLAAMGWRGSARHWRHYKVLHRTMAALAVPLVCSVHSIVGLDFAASLMPGWNAALFPPYFVVGAMYSGFALVIVISAALRWGFGLQGLITLQHFQVMAKILLASSIAMGISYATLDLTSWTSGDPAERDLVMFNFTGVYGPLYWALLFCNVVVPQSLWFSVARRSLSWILCVAVIINIGMWLERLLIIWTTLSHGYATSMWRVFTPTFLDVSLVIAPFGPFVLFFLLVVRLIPPVAMSDTRELAHEGASP